MHVTCVLTVNFVQSMARSSRRLINHVLVIYMFTLNSANILSISICPAIHYALLMILLLLSELFTMSLRNIFNRE